MRFWIGGPRILGLRTGVSFGPNDFATKRQQTTVRPGKPTGAFLYVVHGEHNMSKIGVSTNPDARLAQLRTASAFPIDFAYIGAPNCDAAKAYEIEAAAHEMLSRQRCNGEWFDVAPEMAVAAVAACSHKQGVKIMEVSADLAGKIIRFSGTVGEGRPHTPKKRIPWHEIRITFSVLIGMILSLMVVIFASVGIDLFREGKIAAGFFGLFMSVNCAGIGFLLIRWIWPKFEPMAASDQQSH